ncbi:Major Facilitator Superfamily-like protein 2 [Homarus americanus]|uniref:Major Facilitator Superfamily-like protein 2 n=1 Tax=Homarus americanus TaxID=6706 RepID=A0A8J5JDP0_HOMAM|nr:Major Facilitator Superfamily-like protein 2 [Homarus americanus]
MSIQAKCKIAYFYLSKMKIQAPAAVIGGILIHLTLGNLYSFGNMMTYMVSYMHERVSPYVNYGNFIWVNSITTASQGLFMVCGGLLERKIGPKLTCFVGCSVLSAGILLTHYTIEVSLFTVILTYGLLSGLGISLTYVTPLACGMQWYPEKKGLINGLIVAGFGLGALGSTNLQTLYLNPDNKPPEANGYFVDTGILDRVPSVFIVLALVFLDTRHWPEGENLLGVADNPDESQDELPSTPTVTGIDLRPVQMIQTKTFYIFWMLYLLNTIAIGYINAMYKSFGQTFISDDHYLAGIGSFAAIFNAVGRIVWGRLMDKTSFRTAIRILTLMLTLLFATMPLTKHMGKVGFTGWVVSGPLLAAVNQLMLNAVGYTGCFLTISGILSLSVGITFLVPDGL